MPRSPLAPARDNTIMPHIFSFTAQDAGLSVSRVIIPGILGFHAGQFAAIRQGRWRFIYDGDAEYAAILLGRDIERLSARTAGRFTARPQKIARYR